MTALSGEVDGVSDKIGNTSDSGGSQTMGTLMAKLNRTLDLLLDAASGLAPIKAAAINGDPIRYDIGTVASGGYTEEVLVDQEVSIAVRSQYDYKMVYCGSFVPKHNGFIWVKSDLNCATVRATVYGYYMGQYEVKKLSNSLSGVEQEMEANKDTNEINIYGTLRNKFTTFTLGTQAVNEDLCSVGYVSGNAYETTYAPMRVTKGIPILFFAHHQSTSGAAYIKGLSILYKEVTD